MIYKWIGKLVVNGGMRVARRRFVFRVLIVVGIGTLAVGVGILLASRQVQEG